MAFTTADIEALDANFKAGTQQVTTSDGKSVTWRSVAEYRELRKLMVGEVRGASRTPSSYSVASFSKARS